MNTRWSFALYCLNFGEQGGGLGLRSGTTFWGQSRIINSLLIKSTAFLHHVRVSGSKIYLEKPSVEFSLRCLIGLSIYDIEDHPIVLPIAYIL